MQTRMASTYWRILKSWKVGFAKGDHVNDHLTMYVNYVIINYMCVLTYGQNSRIRKKCHL